MSAAGFSDSMVRIMLKGYLHYSHRKCKPRILSQKKPKDRPSVDELACIVRYLKWKGMRFINIDESGFDRTCRSMYRWVKKGKIATIGVPQAGVRINVIAAAGSGGELLYRMYQGHVDQLNFWGFMRDLARKMDVKQPGWRSQTVVFIDNAAIHKTDALKQLAHDLGIAVLTNIPYKPEYAGIELVFGNWKNAVGRRLADQQDLPPKQRPPLASTIAHGAHETASKDVKRCLEFAWKRLEEAAADERRSDPR